MEFLFSSLAKTPPPNLIHFSSPPTHTHTLLPVDISLWKEDAVEYLNPDGGWGSRVQLRNKAQALEADLEPDPDFSTVSSLSELQCSHL